MEDMNKIIMTTGKMVGYAYASDFSSLGTQAILTSSMPSLTVRLGHTGGRTGSWFLVT